MIEVIEDELLNEFKDENAWGDRRAVSFHQCLETGKIIWPFNKAYFGSVFKLEHGIPLLYINWLSESGYIIWKLRGWV